jgi:uncharacterized phage protein gp47/JayE
MAINIPNINDLSKKIREYFNANITGADAFLSPNTLYVISKVFALALYPLYFLIKYIERQMFSFSADGEYLDLHAKSNGLTRREPSKAYGNMSFTASAAATLAINTVLVRSDGVRFLLKQPKEWSGGTVTLLTQAETAGAIANSVAGTKFTLNSANPIITNITVATGLVGGADKEGDESLRDRISFKKRNIAYAGTFSYFYNILAQEFNYITRIFIDDPRDQSGRYKIYFMMDDTYANGLPLAVDIAEVQEFVDLHYVPGTKPTVTAPILQNIDVNLTVYGLMTDEQAAEIRLEIKETIQSEPNISTTANPVILQREAIDSAVARVLQAGNFTVTSPAANVTIASGRIPGYGTVTINTVNV